MSQVIYESRDEVERRPAGDGGRSEFECPPVPPLAPITLFLGVCAIGSLIGIPGLAIGVAGTLTGLISMRQIRRAEGELGGGMLAKIGFLLSVLFLVSGSALHAYTYVNELPEGHERIAFRWLSSQPIANTKEKGVEFTPEVAALEGKPIFIKGYMYPTQSRVNLSEFVLVKDNKDCCFGGNPNLTDMIVVKLKDGLRVNHRDGLLVSVAGTFHARGLVQSGVLAGVYTIEGTHFQ